MRLHVILGKHDGCDKVYCWYISERKAAHVKAGDLLYVENRNDYAVVTATSDPLTGDDAIKALNQCSARFPLKRVVSFANQIMKQEIVKSFKESVKEEIYAFHEKINALGEKQ
jgi:hypothetical protein